MSYCPACGTEVGESDTFCSECGHQLESSPVQEETIPSGGWWTLILVPPATLTLVILSVFLAGFFDGMGGNLSPALTGVGEALWDIFLAEMVLSIGVLPIAFHLDRRYVRKVANWNPSSLYYLLAIPGLNILLGLSYLQQRHEALGKP